jgi:hypothetical protein
MELVCHDTDHNFSPDIVNLRSSCSFTETWPIKLVAWSPSFPIVIRVYCANLEVRPVFPPAIGFFKNSTVMLVMKDVNFLSAKLTSDHWAG